MSTTEVPPQNSKATRTGTVGLDPPRSEVERVGKAVRERREMLGLSQNLSPYGGPGRKLVGGLETRGVWPKLPATRARWAKALRWKPNAFDVLLDGGDPEEDEIDVAHLEHLLAQTRGYTAEHAPAVHSNGPKGGRGRPVSYPYVGRQVSADIAIDMMGRALAEIRKKMNDALKEARKGFVDFIRGDWFREDN